MYPHSSMRTASMEQLEAAHDHAEPTPGSASPPITPVSHNNPDSRTDDLAPSPLPRPPFPSPSTSSSHSSTSISSSCLHPDPTPKPRIIYADIRNLDGSAVHEIGNSHVLRRDIRGRLFMFRGEAWMAELEGWKGDEDGDGEVGERGMGESGGVEGYGETEGEESDDEVVVRIMDREGNVTILRGDVLNGSNGSLDGQEQADMPMQSMEGESVGLSVSDRDGIVVGGLRWLYRLYGGGEGVLEWVEEIRGGD